MEKEMNSETKRTHLRLNVLLNYLCCLLILIDFHLLITQTNKTTWGIALAFSTLLVILSFNTVHIKAGFWKLTHTKSENLDERERKIAHEALTLSYSIFSIIVLITIYLLIAAYDSRLASDLGFIRNTDIILAFILIYFAHTLPGSILAWRELPEMDSIE